MSVKQDRTAARTVTDIERKYSFGKSFAKVMGIATDAQKTAAQANEVAKECHTEIIKLADSITLKVTGGEVGNTASIVLTVGDEEYSGEINLTGLVTFDSLENSGETQINGDNMVTGAIKSKDGTVVIDLDNNMITIDSTNGTRRIRLSSSGLIGFGLNALTSALDRALTIMPGRVTGSGVSEATSILSTSGIDLSLSVDVGCNLWLGGYDRTVIIDGDLRLGGKTVSWKDNGDGTCTLVGT